MSRWLPPAGGGYSGRSAKTGRYVAKAAAARNPGTTVTTTTAQGGKTSKTRGASGRTVRVTPKGKGPAGISRAT